MAMKRLDKLLADMGIASRSELKAIIKSGRVTVDGVAVRDADAKFDSENCDIALDGKSLSVQKFRYYMMDKPTGALSVTEDRKQQTVLDLLPAEQQRMGLFPVGRLDKDTSGLLILTNDGEFAHKVISPKSGVEKIYLAVVDGEPDEADVKAFEKGIVLKDGTQCLPAKLKLLGVDRCLVTVMEGKYHQVKRMLASRGKPVLELRRLAVGELELGDSLGPGGFRELTENDLCKVLKDFVMEK